MGGASSGSRAGAQLGERACGERGEAGEAPAAAAAEEGAHWMAVLGKVEEIRRSAEQVRELASRIYWDLKDVHRALAVRKTAWSEASWCLLDALISKALRRAAGIAEDMEDFLETLRREVEGTGEEVEGG